MRLALTGLQCLLTDSTTGGPGAQCRGGTDGPAGTHACLRFHGGGREVGAGLSGGHAGAGAAVPPATGEHGLGRQSLVLP